MPKKNNPLLEYKTLLERADLVLKQKKRELKGCKTCNEVKPIYASGKCKTCFLQGRKPKESTNLGKIWESTDGRLKTYILRDEKLVVTDLARHLVGQRIGRSLLRSERVIFNDGNKINCELSNLSLLTDQAISLKCPHCASPLQTDVAL